MAGEASESCHHSNDIDDEIEEMFERASSTLVIEGDLANLLLAAIHEERERRHADQ